MGNSIPEELDIIPEKVGELLDQKKRKIVGVVDLLYKEITAMYENFPRDCAEEICSYLPECMICFGPMIREDVNSHPHCADRKVSVRFKCVVCGKSEVEGDVVHSRCRKMAEKLFKKMNTLEQKFDKEYTNTFSAAGCEAFLVNNENNFEVVHVLIIGIPPKITIEFINRKKSRVEGEETNSNKMNIHPPFKTKLEIDVGMIFIRVEKEEGVVETSETETNNISLRFLFRIDMMSKILRLLADSMEITETPNPFLLSKVKDHETNDKIRERIFSKTGLVKYILEMGGLYSTQHFSDEYVTEFTTEFTDLPYLQKHFIDSISESSTRKEVQSELKTIKGTDRGNFRIFPDIYPGKCARPRRCFYSRLRKYNGYYIKGKKGKLFKELSNPICHFAFCLLDASLFEDTSPFSSTIHQCQLEEEIPNSNVLVRPAIFFDGMFYDFNEFGVASPKISLSELTPISNGVYLYRATRDVCFLRHIRAVELIHKYNTTYSYKGEKPKRFTTNERNSMDFVLDFINIVGGERIRIDGFNEIFRQQQMFVDLYRDGVAKMSLTIPEKMWNMYFAKDKEQKYKKFVHTDGSRYEGREVVFFNSHKHLDGFVAWLKDVSSHTALNMDFPGVRELLCIFDRIFWSRELNIHNEFNESVTRNHSCPFNHPNRPFGHSGESDSFH